MQKQLKAQEEHTPLMSWTTKAIPASPRKIRQAELQIIVGFSLIFLYAAWLASVKIDNSIGISATTGLALIAFATYIIMVIVRQKTVYNYTISSEKGRVDYYLHYPDFAGTLFKSIAALAILSFIGTAIYTGSFLFLIGPVAMALASAQFLLFWKNETHTRNSTLWHNYNFVTVDHERLMVITHCTDQTVGFEARFPDKQLLEKYLKTLKTLLPETAIYTQKKWEQ
ncbi:permease [Pseudomonas sp. TH43]|uniref:permease n=1 Tax=Pseudomonas sp. TH43 TaxID=2796407 RepID=UPI0019128F66|nr:permease [Pseudomonas sp. TH43]MBK5375820.1 permease [Pseudomonas sp. TH43]